MLLLPFVPLTIFSPLAPNTNDTERQRQSPLAAVILVSYRSTCPRPRLEFLRSTFPEHQRTARFIILIIITTKYSDDNKKYTRRAHDAALDAAAGHTCFPYQLQQTALNLLPRLLKRHEQPKQHREPHDPPQRHALAPAPRAQCARKGIEPRARAAGRDRYGGGGGGAGARPGYDAGVAVAGVAIAGVTIAVDLAEAAAVDVPESETDARARDGGAGDGVPAEQPVDESGWERGEQRAEGAPWDVLGKVGALGKKEKEVKREVGE
ncbi:hypothetical protein B0H12DRAFT_1135210, partial [Mycena haematopus]